MTLTVHDIDCIARMKPLELWQSEFFWQKREALQDAARAYLAGSEQDEILARHEAIWKDRPADFSPTESDDEDGSDSDGVRVDNHSANHSAADNRVGDALEALRKELRKSHAACVSAATTRDNNRAEIERLREALEWYADPPHYVENKTGKPYGVICDLGWRARAALKEGR